MNVRRAGTEDFPALAELWRELMKLRDLEEEQEVIVRVNPDIYQAVRSDEHGILADVERSLRVHLVLKPDDNLHHEQFDVVRV